MLKQNLFLFFLISTFYCCNQTTNSNEILFICPHGAARSPIAAAYFNKLAKEKNLNYHAIFRGTEPDETLSTRTIEGLTSEGFGRDAIEGTTNGHEGTRIVLQGRGVRNRGLCHGGSEFHWPWISREAL